jgi:hypothetical protein
MLFYWVIIMFGYNISGSHFNPVVTVVNMFRSDKSIIENKTLGIINIFA